MTMVDEPPTTASDDETPDRPHRSDDHVIAGVAAGLAEWLGIDAIWVRLGFVLLTLLSGLGVFLYIAGLLLMPPAGGRLHRVRLVAGVVVLVVAGLVVASHFDIPTGPLAFAAVLVGVGLALWKPRGAPRRPLPPPTSAPTAEPLPMPELMPVTETPGHTRRRRRRAALREREPASPLGRITLAAALGVSALLAAIDLAGADIAPQVIAGIAAIVLGAGALVGAFAGRARWLLWPGLLAVAIALCAGAFDGLGLPSVWSSDGSRTEQPTGPASYSHGNGDLYIDLSAPDLVGPIKARLAAGTIHLWTPDDVRVDLRARVGLGSIDVEGQTVNGYRREVHRTTGPSTGRVVTVDAAVGLGSIRLERGRFVERPVDPVPPVVPKGPVVPVRPLPSGAAERLPDGSVIYDNGITVHADGSVDFPDGATLQADGTLNAPAGMRELPDGTRLLSDGTALLPDGRIVTTDGQVIDPARR
jgi:phage shock protein PspC (stress-responsive transcriptional regulator)